MKAQWQQAKRVFQLAIELPPEQRKEFVHSQCTDEATSAQVLEMLHNHFEDSTFLASPFSPDENTDQISRDPLIGQTIDDYLVRQRIGKGGMGSVYEATQTDPKRSVALKVLRNDCAFDETTIQRFHNESEVLAKLQHPNIAHIYASGSFRDSEGSQPWFAMELIDGFTLNEYLRQTKLAEADKLEIFLQICDGVSHAHRRDVVHRDLKPANILIENTEASPRPKIVDFGIARITAGELARAGMTHTSAVLGSIDYLSPEQANLGSSQVDQRCDIYSLGIIAFEMLTGRLPHDRRSGTLTKVLNQIAVDPGIPLRKARRSFSRDLEVIIAKAIAPDLNQRYQTVEEFSGDIRRYLRNEPIRAMPPSIAYRVKKYVSRNQVLVLGTLATVIALTAGLVSSILIARQATKSATEAQYQARKAVAVNSFITNDFLGQLLNSIGKRDATEPIELESLIASASSRVGQMFEDEPLVEAAVRNEIGTIYYNTGSTEAATNEYSQALDLWQKGLGEDHPDTLKAVNNLAQALMASSRGKEPRTLELCTRAFEGRKRVLGMEHSATIASMNNLAQLYLSRDRPEEAEQLFLEGIRVIKGSTPDSMTTRITLEANLGTLYLRQKKTKEALAVHRSSYGQAKDFFGLTHPLCLKAGIRYVQSLDRDRQLELALSELEPIMLQYETVAENEPGALFIPLRLKARILRHKDQHELARQHLQRALDIAGQSPTKHAQEIRKIEKDMKRLARD